MVQGCEESPLHYSAREEFATVTVECALQADVGATRYSEYYFYFPGYNGGADSLGGLIRQEGVVLSL